ncbi:MAG: hypothetical protein GC192_06645 [Bacteroidetes bacterium]|nr:hypothetical protein [Bacteroidota bacterium]
MKKQFTILFFIAFGVLAAFNVQGQNYSSAIGARLGYPLALSYKKFISDAGAIELYGAYRGYTYYNWFSVNGAYQYHQDFPNVPNLQWYVGAGAGVYFFSYDDGYFNTNYASTRVAVQGYLGLEYTFEEVPISISADWIPTIFLNKGYGNAFGSGYAGLGVRYVIGR